MRKTQLERQSSGNQASPYWMWNNTRNLGHRMWSIDAHCWAIDKKMGQTQISDKNQSWILYWLQVTLLLLVFPAVAHITVHHHHIQNDSCLPSEVTGDTREESWAEGDTVDLSWIHGGHWWHLVSDRNDTTPKHTRRWEEQNREQRWACIHLSDMQYCECMDMYKKKIFERTKKWSQCADAEQVQGVAECN